MKGTIHAVLTFFVLVAWVASAQAGSPDTRQARDAVLAEANKGGYTLVTPDEIKTEYLKDPGPLFLVDTRQEWAYRMQHIKGAVWLSATPTWEYQYYPSARSEMKKVFGPDRTMPLLLLL